VVLLLAAGLPAALRAQTIDTVIVWNRNIFDTEDDAPGFIPRVANALHIRTRPSVIRRTLLLGPGDPYDSARVAESERALRSLNVFRLVRVDTVRLGPGGPLALRAVTADGWSSKPQASFSSAGGDETWEVAFVEGNFLGTASQLAVAYGRTPDRRRLDLVYVNPHFLWRRTALYARAGDFSDGRRSYWQFGVPFYQTAARWALETYGESADERVLVFRDDTLASSPQRRALRAGIAGGVAAHATSRDRVRLLFGAEWRREDFAPETTTVFPRSVFVTGRAGIEVGHSRFRVLEHVNAYGRREDIDLSQVLRVGAVVESGVGFEARGQASAVWRRGFVVLRGEASGLEDSTRVRGGVTIVSQSLPAQTLIAHAEGGALHRPKPGAEFDLWNEQRGPRLFGAHAFTGTRMLWLALEDRILVADDVWGLMAFGLAPFVDYGGAWYDDEPARLEGDVGVALRFGPTRSVRGEAAEIAVGYRFGGGWGISLRKGFVF
jgi:hypothetical protein